MATRRAQITEETAGQMYGDVLDRLDRKPASRPAVKKASHPDSSASETPRVKATFYLTRDDILAIDRMQSAAFMSSGKKPERSQIITEAVQLLIKQKKLDPK